jgi:DNA polymerase-3 subunit alpha
MGAKADRDYAQRKNEKQRISYPHPELQEALTPILAETYGLIVYQEQVLEVLAAVGGYTYGTAELIFNAMRKKDHAKMTAAKPDFIDRMKKNGYSNDAIDALWETLVPFADYSFNKSHSSGYGLIAYWTAYLKANHPKEWMAALLSNEDKPEKLAEYLSECHRMAIPILPPDINDSNETFTPTEEGIRYGLASIKGVGKSAVDAVLRNRPYRSFGNYLNTVPAGGLNSGAVSAFARAGAFDVLVGSREGLIETVDGHCERARGARKAKRAGQRGLVKPRYIPPTKPVNLPQRRQWERETLGVELSVGTLHLRPTSPLGEAELVWIKEALTNHPGMQSVVLDFGLIRTETGLRVNNNAKEVLEKLGKLEISEVAH